MTRDQGRVLFSRLFSRVEVADRYTAPRVEAPRYLGQVYNGGSIPTVAGRVYLTRPVDVAVNDTEGAVPVFTLDTSVSVPVLCIGGVATAGTNLIAEEIDGRWVADLTGASGAVCGGTATINVKCAGINQSGVSVTITQGSTSFSGTTNASGNVNFAPGASGTWTITATKTGLAPYTGSFTFSCVNTSVAIVMFGATVTISGYVEGCNGMPMPSPAIEIRQSGTLYGTGTADAGGYFSIAFPGPSGTYDVTAIKSTFNTSGQSTLVFGCNGSTTLPIPIQMTAATGYVCFECHDWDATPTSTTLTLTINWAGAQTMTYDGGISGWKSAPYAYTGTLYTDHTLTVAATLTATIVFTVGVSGQVLIQGWCLKAQISNILMSDTYVAANPTMVELRNFNRDHSPCTNVSPLNLSYAFSQPDVASTAGTATLTE